MQNQQDLYLLSIPNAMLVKLPSVICCPSRGFDTYCSKSGKCSQFGRIFIATAIFTWQTRSSTGLHPNLHLPHHLLHHHRRCPSSCSGAWHVQGVHHHMVSEGRSQCASGSQDERCTRGCSQPACGHCRKGEHLRKVLVKDNSTKAM